MLAAAIGEARARLFVPIGGIFASLHQSSNDLHAEIFGAIEDKDPTAAEDLMRRHITGAHEAVVKVLGR